MVAGHKVYTSKSTPEHNEFCEVFKNTFFTEPLPMTASACSTLVH